MIEPYGLDEFKQMMNKEFEIRRKKRTPTGRGGFKEEYETVMTIRGRMSKKSAPTEITIAEQWRALVTHRFYTLAEYKIFRQDLIVPVDSPEMQFRAIGVEEPSLLGEHQEIDCEIFSNEKTKA